MTHVLVTGASGTLGRRLIARPGATAVRLRATSRRPIVSEDAGAAEWLHSDLISGEGLAETLDGIDTVIHAASAPRGDTRRTDVEGTQRLLDAAARAGVSHVLYVSIVGVDRIPYPYYQHKLAAEQLVERAGVPWSIVRGTQFHDLVDGMMHRMARFPIAVVPAGFRSQPIHVDEFAAAVWHCVAQGAAGRAPDVAGPEVLTFDALMRQWLDARRLRKPIVRVPVPGRMSASIRRGEGTAPDRAVGRVTWAEWLSAKYSSPT